MVGAFIRLILHTRNSTGVPTDQEGGLYKAFPRFSHVPFDLGVPFSLGLGEEVAAILGLLYKFL